MQYITSDMGAYHPQVVHFAVALVFAGVGFRILSLTKLFSFANAAATWLVLLGTVACFAAAQTGELAHGPVERIPGARPAVEEHEQWGERTRNGFVVISVLEVLALATTSRQHARATAVSLLAAVAGLGGLAAMFQTARYGGGLVYNYAGGVGIRSGRPEDVNHLFLAGAYQQALQDRQAGRSDQAMALIEMAADRFPSNLDLQLLTAEWTTDVKKDPAAALRRLDAAQIPPDDTRSRVRAGLARATALQAGGNRDGARAVLQTLAGEFPNNAQVKRSLQELTGGQ